MEPRIPSLLAPVTPLRVPGVGACHAADRGVARGMADALMPLLADMTTRLVALDERLRLDLPPTEPGTRWEAEVIPVPTVGNAVSVRLRYRLVAV